MKKVFKLINSSVSDHLVFFNHSASFVDFSILTRDIFIEIEREPSNTERPNIFEEEYSSSTTVPTWHALEIRLFLEFHLFLVLATLFPTEWALIYL